MGHGGPHLAAASSHVKPHRWVLPSIWRCRGSNLSPGLFTEEERPPVGDRDEVTAGVESVELAEFVTPAGTGWHSGGHSGHEAQAAGAKVFGALGAEPVKSEHRHMSEGQLGGTEPH